MIPHHGGSCKAGDDSRLTFSCISPILNTESKRFFRRFCYGGSPDCQPLGQRVEHQPRRREPVRDRHARPARRRRDGCVRTHGRAAHGRRHARAADALEHFRCAAAACGGLHRRHRRGRCARHRPGHAAHRDLRREYARAHRRGDELHIRCGRAAGRGRADADRDGLLPRHQRHAHDRAHRRAQPCRARQLHAPHHAAHGRADAAHGGLRRV